MRVRAFWSRDPRWNLVLEFTLHNATVYTEIATLYMPLMAYILFITIHEQPFAKAVPSVTGIYVVHVSNAALSLGSTLLPVPCCDTDPLRICNYIFAIIAFAQGNCARYCRVRSGYLIPALWTTLPFCASVPGRHISGHVPSRDADGAVVRSARQMSRALR